MYKYTWKYANYLVGTWCYILCSMILIVGLPAAAGYACIGKEILGGAIVQGNE